MMISLSEKQLVNKPLSAAGISEDNAQSWESEKWTLGREARLGGQLWNFDDNLSAEGIILRYISKLERGLFTL